MSFTINNAFINDYTGNLRFLAQQGGSRLRAAVHEEPIKGEALYFEYLAPDTATKITARHQDTPLGNAQHMRRKLTPFRYAKAQLVEEEDKLVMLVDPTSGYAQNIASALARAQDDEIISGAFATAYSGHAGATALTWPNGNSESSPTSPAGAQISVSSWAYGTGSGTIGLTISKLIEAKVAIDAGEGDDNEPMYVCCSAKQIGNLLATTEATSADYNTVQALVGGKIDTFMGFKFIRSERLLLNASSYRRVMAWRKSALGFGVVEDITGSVDKRADKLNAMQVLGKEYIGATRLEEVKLAEIPCSE